MAGITLCTAEAEKCLFHSQCYRASAPGGYWQSYSDFSDLIQADGTCPQYWPVQAEPVDYEITAPGPVRTEPMTLQDLKDAKQVRDNYELEPFAPVLPPWAAKIIDG